MRSSTVNFLSKALASSIIDSTWWLIEDFRVCTRLSIDFPYQSLISQSTAMTFPSCSINNFLSIAFSSFHDRAYLHAFRLFTWALVAALRRFLSPLQATLKNTLKTSSQLITRCDFYHFDDFACNLPKVPRELFCIIFHSSVDNTSRAASYRKGSKSTELTWKYMRQKTTTKAPQVLADR